jgi:hypothetical protein
LARLTTFLLRIPGSSEPSSAAEQIACIVEINHGLLITALLEAGFSVFPVNPKLVDQQREPAGAGGSRNGCH